MDVTLIMWTFLNPEELLLSSVVGAYAANHWVQQSCGHDLVLSCVTGADTANHWIQQSCKGC